MDRAQKPEDPLVRSDTVNQERRYDRGKSKTGCGDEGAESEQVDAPAKAKKKASPKKPASDKGA